MPTSKKLDILNKLDYQIFERATQDVNYFTDYYFRTPHSGMKFSNDYPDSRIVKQWVELRAAWREQTDHGSLSTVEPATPVEKVLDFTGIKKIPPAGFKNKQWTWKGTEYEVLQGLDGEPIFWFRYGFLMQEWQKQAFHASQSEQTIVGGYGSGKTSYIGISLAVFAAIFPFFRGFAVAPQSVQAMEVYKFLSRISANSPWYDRWVVRDSEHHHPGFVLANDFIGESRIEFYSIEDDPDKILTLEGDCAYLDQAEKIDDLDEMVKNIGTRTRGMVNDRPRIGRLCLTANAGDNPSLWYRYDLAEVEPETFLSITVKTEDNLAISENDFKRLARRSGGTPEDIERWLHGVRPAGPGEHFPRQVIARCVDYGLNAIMDGIIREREQLKGPSDLLTHYEQFVKKSDPRAGIYHWEMPPDFNSKRIYFVIADPGQGDPPHRNAAVVAAWDITGFPKEAATLRAFHWIHGKGEYWPFISEFERMVQVYHAQGRCAFDSTGMQKAFNELVFEQLNLMAEPMDMTGPSGKYPSLNAAKVLMGRALIRFPYIPGINLQLSHYVLPDNKIPQDIVMMIAMAAQYIRQYYWFDKSDDIDLEKSQLLPMQKRSLNRYKRDPHDRHERNRTRR